MTDTLKTHRDVQLASCYTNLVSWIHYRMDPSGHTRWQPGDGDPVIASLDEFIRLSMWARVIGCASRTYSGVPASDALIAREAINIPKKVRDAALNFAVNDGLLERREEHGVMRYRSTDLFDWVLEGQPGYQGGDLG